jgi:hypothetical protein
MAVVTVVDVVGVVLDDQGSVISGGRWDVAGLIGLSSRIELDPAGL